jgi:hypothetical protein
MLAPRSMDDADRPEPSPEPSGAARPPPAPARAGFFRRFFLMSDRLAAAEQQLLGGSPSRQAAFRRATAALEAAEVVLVRDQEDTASACVLLRDALWWAVVATGKDLDPQASATDAWAALATEELSPLSEAECEATRRAFVERDREQARDELAALRWGVDAVLAAPHREARVLARLRMTRRVRWALVALIPVLIAASIVAWRFAAARRDNLALHRPTTTSGQGGAIATSDGVVDGKTFGIGFETARESRPWLRIDLRETKRIHQITVYNADHCCFERAVPLVIEVSTDGEKYRQVARRDRPFGVWQVDIDPVDARYVKLTVDKTTIFHLSEVEVR